MALTLALTTHTDRPFPRPSLSLSLSVCLSVCLCVCLCNAAVTCPSETADNAVFASVLVGESAGACVAGYTGNPRRTCVFNATTGLGQWSATTGACTRTHILWFKHTQVCVCLCV
jgi:hypothetical protein